MGQAAPKATFVAAGYTGMMRWHTVAQWKSAGRARRRPGVDAVQYGL